MSGESWSRSVLGAAGSVVGLLLIALSILVAGSPPVQRDIDPAVAAGIAGDGAAIPAVGGMMAIASAPTATIASDQPTIGPVAPATVASGGRLPAPPAAADGSSTVYDRGTSGRREIALTFDAGADRGLAERILDILAANDVHASFGITGAWASDNPELVKRMVAEGHMLFNHTWDHRSFTGYSTAGWDAGVRDRAARTDELRLTATEIADLTGYDVAPYFRPPYGDLDPGVLADVGAAGYTATIMWTCDSLGWNGATVDQILERCAGNAEPGDIILMHVGAASLDAEALPQLIETLERAGYALVTIEQLLQPT